MEKKKLPVDFITIITLLVGLATIFFQIFPPKTPIDQVKSAIYFLAILGYIGILYFVMWVTDKIKSYLNQINKNSEDIKELKEEMSIQKRFSEIEKRLSILEVLRKNRRGKFAIDQNLIFLAILLILFYLYLRSLGIL
jgi:Flp pilus assembly protein TadB